MSRQPLHHEIPVEYRIDSSLRDREEAIVTRRELPEGESLRNGIALLIIWDRLKVLGERIVRGTGLSIVDAGVIDDSTGINFRSIRQIAALVEMERYSYDNPDVTQTVHVTPELKLQLDLHALSQGYSTLDPVFTDASLFFCNLHEIIQQRPE